MTARTGQPRLVALEGPGGIGKTAFVHCFLERSGERCVLRTRGEEMEASLAYSVVERLTAGLAQLPDPRRQQGY